MGKLIGYILALIGLAILALSFLNIIPIPSFIKPPYVLVAGFALIILGIALTLNKSNYKAKQSAEEVPIYEGEGKHRKIVGYKRAK